VFVILATKTGDDHMLTVTNIPKKVPLPTILLEYPVKHGGLFLASPNWSFAVPLTGY